jgi:hypothetical protein
MFNALPGPGGLLDQEAELIVKMQLVLVAKQEKHERDMKEAKRGTSHKGN